MNDLIKLRDEAKDLTVLFVDDSIALQAQLEKFLKKFFKTVYTANNGEAGLETYKKQPVDIVITDLNMPVMNGFEMIREIRNLDPDVKIIIASAYSDSDNLIESIHLGIKDFIPKPVDFKTLQEVLLKSVEELKGYREKVNHILTTDILELIKKYSLQIELINTYKGVPIIYGANIVDVNEEVVSIKVTEAQLFAIKYERQTVIQSPLLSKPIKAELSELQKEQGIVKLKELTCIDQNINKRENVRVVPSKDFQSTFYFKQMKFEIKKVLYVSLNMITFRVSKLEEFIAEDVQIDINIYFQTTKATMYHELGKTAHISAKSKVYKIKKILNDEYDVVLQLILEPKNKESLSSYITHREIELIKEFKELIRLEKEK
jgi:YesN/AraC family two-component response regulator